MQKTEKAEIKSKHFIPLVTSFLTNEDSIKVAHHSIREQLGLATICWWSDRGPILVAKRASELRNFVTEWREHSEVAIYLFIGDGKYSLYVAPVPIIGICVPLRFESTRMAAINAVAIKDITELGFMELSDFAGIKTDRTKVLWITSMRVIREDISQKIKDELYGK